jgi:hypothetical protein
MSLYKDAKAAGLEIDSHESDLYLKDTPEARALLAEHGKKGRRTYEVDGWNVSTFTSQIDGARWLDIPFDYEPWYERLVESVPIFEGSDPQQE